MARFTFDPRNCFSEPIWSVPKVLRYPLLTLSYPHNGALWHTSPRFETPHTALENISSKIKWYSLMFNYSNHVSDPRNNSPKPTRTAPTVLHFLLLKSSYHITVHTKTQKEPSILLKKSLHDNTLPPPPKSKCSKKQLTKIQDCLGNLDTSLAYFVL